MAIRQPIIAGIYVIRNLINNKCYIGSAVNIVARWRGHQSDLAKGDHHSRYLQRAWNLHGADAFLFEILEIIDDAAELLAREQWHLDASQSYRREFGYNLYSVAGSPLGTKWSDEARVRVSAQRREWWSNPEYRAKVIAARIGHHQSEETKAKRSAANKGQTWTQEQRQRHLDAQGSAETKQKKSFALKGRIFSEEHRAKIGERSRGRKMPRESVARMAAKLRGRKASPEQRARLQALALLKSENPDWCAKMADFNRKKAEDPEFRQRLKEAWARRKACQTDEDRAANRERLLGINLKLTVEQYRQVKELLDTGMSQKAIGAKVGLRQSTVSRIKNDQYPAYAMLAAQVTPQTDRPAEQRPPCPSAFYSGSL